MILGEIREMDHRRGRYESVWGMEVSSSVDDMK